MVNLVMGYPGSGKGTFSQALMKGRTVYLNRDQKGGKVADLVPEMVAAIKSRKHVVVDNTFPTRNSRLPFIKAAIENGTFVICHFLQTSIEDAQFNVCMRMMERYGQIIDPRDMASKKDPNIFPPVVLFKYRKEMEPPTPGEGFREIKTVPFERKWPDKFKNKAIFVDYDGTLRKTKSGAKWPCDPDDIEILPNRASILKEYIDRGYLVFGVSNQSGISKGTPTLKQAQACFDRTNQMLGLDIPVAFCPHRPAPITCYCRKPMPGFFVKFCWEHSLLPEKCIMVGDQTSDKTFAQRSGMSFARFTETGLVQEN